MDLFIVGAPGRVSNEEVEEKLEKVKRYMGAAGECMIRAEPHKSTLIDAAALEVLRRFMIGVADALRGMNERQEGRSYEEAYAKSVDELEGALEALGRVKRSYLFRDASTRECYGKYIRARILTIEAFRAKYRFEDERKMEDAAEGKARFVEAQQLYENDLHDYRSSTKAAARAAVMESLIAAECDDEDGALRSLREANALYAACGDTDGFDRTWREILKTSHSTPDAIGFCGTEESGASGEQCSADGAAGSKSEKRRIAADVLFGLGKGVVKVIPVIGGILEEAVFSTLSKKEARKEMKVVRAELARIENTIAERSDGLEDVISELRDSERLGKSTRAALEEIREVIVTKGSEMSDSLAELISRAGDKENTVASPSQKVAGGAGVLSGVRAGTGGASEIDEMERRRFMGVLNNLTPDDMAQLIVALQAGPHVPENDGVRRQAAKLLRWADSSTGPGWRRVRAVAEEVLPSAFGKG